MPHAHSSPRGFTLMELVVVTAIGGMMFALAAPAVQKGREDLNRRRCANNLRQLSMAMLAYENANGGLPPMAMSWDGAHANENQPGPGGWWDGHSWYSLVGQYIGEDAWASLLDLSVSMSHLNNALARRRGLRLKVHACPADIGLQRNEWGSNTWARVRSNYVVNAGNTNYGQLQLHGVPFLGAPFSGAVTTPLPSITDGLANTLMMSEIVVFPSTVRWGGAYSEIQTALGQTFTGFNPPNSNAPDGISYGRNGNLDQATAIVLYAQQGIPYPTDDRTTSDARHSLYIAARSKHAGGVNASHCDGSVAFYNDSIDPAVWRALSTAQGADAPIAPATKPPPRKRK